MALTLPQVEVIQAAPLPGFGSTRWLFPGNVQQGSAFDVDAAGAGTLPEYMNRRMVNVTVSDVQGSPYQLDLNYRGQRLSPVLGSSQGLSLWLDGVRMNQPFGDVAQWDLLPEAAIAGIALVPGSNPLYGLNTLAGAVVLTTKSGLTHPGTELEVSTGSRGRQRIELAHGRRWQSGSHAFVAATALADGGWRDRSPGHLANIFLNVGRQEGSDGWSVELLDAGSSLAGNGLLNDSLAARNWNAVYTARDVTNSHETLMAAQVTRALGHATRLTLRAWHREGRRTGHGGDVNDDWREWLAGCAGAASAPRCTDPADPGFVSQQAVINTSRSRQRETGAAAQWTRDAGGHQITLGADLSLARIAHDQFSQPATFDAERNAIAFVPGDGVHEVALRGRTSRFSLVAVDAWQLGAATRLTASARWGATTVTNELGEPAPLERERFHYRKLNPALGLTHAWGERLVVFASASQGSRVPTALELGCADASRPCVLPTGLQSDPFLRQVVARTVEVGARTRPLHGVELSAALFHATNSDDIMFVRSGVSQAGFFTNVDRTRRRGLELSGHGRSGRVQWHAGYTWLDATYGSSFVLPGPLSTEDRPNVVRPGTRIAGLPQQVLKLSGDWRFAQRWTLVADLQAVSSQGVAGNEAGNRPELGRLPGYSVLHMRLRWQPSDRWELYVRIHNILDRRYATYAAGNIDLFPAGVELRPGDEPASARFIAPGAPRSAIVGVRYVWE